MRDLIYALSLFVGLCSLTAILVSGAGLIKAILSKSLKEQEEKAALSVLKLLDDTIRTSVAATNQRMVNPLKKMGQFLQLDKDEAFEYCRTMVINTTNTEELKRLVICIGNLDIWINNRIEYYVKKEKGVGYE